MKKILLILAMIGAQALVAQNVVTVDISNFPTEEFKEGNFTQKYYKDVQNNFLPFLGTWKYQNGSQTFLVRLWKVTKEPYSATGNPVYYIDEIRGHYKLVENYGLPNETIIYTSEKNIGVTGSPWPCVIFADATVPNILHGRLYDVAGPLNVNYQMGVFGYVDMVILPGSPAQASWKVEPAKKEWFAADEPRDFTIPTNVTLTKVN